MIYCFFSLRCIAWTLLNINSFLLRQVNCRSILSDSYEFFFLVPLYLMCSLMCLSCSTGYLIAKHLIDKSHLSRGLLYNRFPESDGLVAIALEACGMSCLSEDWKLQQQHSTHWLQILILHNRTNDGIFFIRLSFKKIQLYAVFCSWTTRFCSIVPRLGAVQHWW